MQLRQKCDGDGSGADESPPSSTTFDGIERSRLTAQELRSSRRSNWANPRQRVEAADNTQEKKLSSYTEQIQLTGGVVSDDATEQHSHGTFWIEVGAETQEVAVSFPDRFGVPSEMYTFTPEDWGRIMAVINDAVPQRRQVVETADDFILDTSVRDLEAAHDLIGTAGSHLASAAGPCSAGVRSHIVEMAQDLIRLRGTLGCLIDWDTERWQDAEAAEFRNDAVAIR